MMPLATKKDTRIFFLEFETKFLGLQNFHAKKQNITGTEEQL